jgi:hypothetical protein
MTEAVTTRATAPFTVFYRTISGEGGYSCQTCNVRRHDSFPRAADAFAVAAQHLNVCRAALRHRPLEGTALLDGATHAVVLRDGIMILALNTVFETSPRPRRVVA